MENPNDMQLQATMLAFAALRGWDIHQPVLDFNIAPLYDEVRRLEMTKLYYSLKAYTNYIDGAFEYHYATPRYVTATCWEKDEEVKVYAVRMTDYNTLTLEVEPTSDPSERMQISGEDVAYGQIEGLVLTASDRDNGQKWL